MKEVDSTFSETLIRLIDRKGLKDSEVYKKANIDRKLFSKIKNNPYYKPGKVTAIAFAIALELSLDETKDFIRKAGYALTHRSKFDIIIEYFLLEAKSQNFLAHAHHAEERGNILWEQIVVSLMCPRPKDRA